MDAGASGGAGTLTKVIGRRIMRLLASIVRLYLPHTEIRIGSIAVMSAT